MRPSADQPGGTPLEGHLRAAAELVPATVRPTGGGYLVWNPASLVRRICLDLPGLSRPPDVARPIYAAAQDGEHRYVVADVPRVRLCLDSGRNGHHP